MLDVNRHHRLTWRSLEEWAATPEVVLWAYLAFTQYLTIWYGDLPEEITWYVRRQEGAWLWITLALVIASLGLPVVLLLARALKRNVWSLGLIAGWIVLTRWLDMFWLVRPALTLAPDFHWLDAALTLGLGGLWAALFFWRLQQRPVFPYAPAAAPKEAERARA